MLRPWMYCLHLSSEIFECHILDEPLRFTKEMAGTQYERYL